MGESTHIPMVDGTRLRVISYGNGGPGAPIILVHGLASNARLWDGVAPLLADAGHPTFAVDLRGHGESDSPEAGHSTSQAAHDVLDLAGHLGLDRPAVVGQSWGGSIAIELASRHPTSIQSAIGVDGGAINLAAVFDDWDSAVRALTPPKLAGTPAATMRAMMSDYHPDFSETAIDSQMANFRIRQDGTIEPRLRLDSHLAIVRSMWDTDVTEQLHSVDVPTSLLLVRDARRTAEAQAWLAAITARNPALTVTYVADRVHDVHAQDPSLVAMHVLAHLKEG